MSLVKKTLLEVPVTIANNSAVLEEIQKNLTTGYKVTTIFTPNPEIVLLARKNPQLLKAMQKFDLALPDGVGLIWAGKVLKSGKLDLFGGIYLMEKLIDQASKKGYIVGLIGGFNGVALAAGECLLTQYPKLNIFTVGDFEVDENGQDKSEKKTLMYWDNRGNKGNKRNREDSARGTKGRGWEEIKGESVNILISKYLDIVQKPAIIFVALGAPKQEFFISNIKYLISSVKYPVVLMAVGGALDEISGKLPRCPRWVHKAGFKWFWRLILQPWRIGRQLKLVKFVIMVAKESFLRLEIRTRVKS